MPSPHFKALQNGFFILLLAIATALFAWLMSGYLYPLFWAVVLAILFRPLHIRFLNLCGSRHSLASLLTILSIILVIGVPIYFLGVLVANEAVQLYINLTQADAQSLASMQTLESLIAPLSQFGIDTATALSKTIALGQSVVAEIGSYALDIGRATLSTLISAAIMLYILFFALRDGDRIMQRISNVLPLGDEKERLLFGRFVSIVHAMFKGTFIIAIIQGAIGGILFVVAGIPSAILWAVVMALCALIPAIGPALVWLPAGVLLLASGSTWQGIMVLAVGFFVISLIDNLLRPVLVAKDAALSDVMILLSVLGGLSLFGIAGLIIGPVIAAVFVSMWQLFEHDYARDLKKFG